MSLWKQHDVTLQNMSSTRNNQQTIMKTKTDNEHNLNPNE